jgi:hypothetical protein
LNPACEECDDGNLIDDDGCDSNCTYTACGNGIKTSDEECDGSDLGGADCTTQGYAYGRLACSSNCTFDPNGCSAVRFVDNNNGTVTDYMTGLMWEKKDNAGGLHDVDKM